MPTSLLTYYDPQTAPIRTLASFKSPLQSPPGSGVYRNLSNLRWGDNGQFMVRNGTVKLTSSPIQATDTGTSTGSNSNSTLKDTGKTWGTNLLVGAAVLITSGVGAGQTSFVTANTGTQLTVSPVWTTIPDATSVYEITAQPRALKALTFQGVPGKLLFAAKDWLTHKTSIYLSSDPTNFGSTITPSSGKYGDTRLSSDGSGHDYPTRFAVVNDRFTGKDCIVIQNGYDNPRVWDGTNMAVHKAVLYSPADGSWQTQWGARSYFNISIGGSILSGTPVNYTLALATAPGWPVSAGYYFLAFATTATSGLSGAMTISSGPVTPTNEKNLIITLGDFTNQNIVDFLASFKIQIRGHQSSTLYTVYDSSNGTGSYIAVGGDATNFITHLTFPLPALASPDTSIDGLVLTPLSGVTAAALISGEIYGISLGGAVLPDAQLMVGFVNSASRAESPAQALVNQSSLLKYQGMARSLRGALWQLDSRMYLTPTIAFTYTNAQVADAVDTARVYMELNGESTFTYLKSLTLATWNGSAWTASAVGGLAFTVTDDPTSRLLWLTAPSDFVQPVPVSRAEIVGAASRLLVGARDDSQDATPRVALSEGGNGFSFRFASAPDLSDPNTSYEDRIPAENVLAFAAAAASTFAAATIYAMTDRSVFLVDPTQIGTPGYLRRQATIGTNSPDSLAEHRGTIYYLDTDRRVQRMDGYKSAPMSLGFVDDKLLAIPITRAQFAQGFHYRDRYYLPYSPSGASRNTNILVFSENAAYAAGPAGYAGYVGLAGFAGGWESDDVLPYPMTCECVEIQRDGTAGGYGDVGTAKVLMIGADCNCYQFETGTSDLGSDVAIQIQTGDLHDPNYAGGILGQIHYLVDALNGKTLTATHTYKPDGGTSSATVTFSNSSPYDWVKSPRPTVASGDGRGVAVSTLISGSLPGGTNIYGIKVDVETTDIVPRMSS